MSKYVQLLGTAAVIGLLANYPAHAQMAFHYNGPVETPEQNQIRSAHYDQLLETNPGFRAYRERKECGPIHFDQNLRQDCFGSFDKFEPMAVR
jgi:hypothetical protein